MVANYAAGRGDSARAIPLDEIGAVLEETMGRVRRIIGEAAARSNESVTVLRMGDPRLLQQVRSRSTNFGTPELQAARWPTCRTPWRTSNGAGLAAPQIGVGLRVVIFGVKPTRAIPTPRKCPSRCWSIPRSCCSPTTMEEGWEGCLSVPGMRGVVPRYTQLRYSGLRRAGQPFEREAEGFHARVVQHECDHLDGILYPMRMRDFSRFGFIEELFPGQELPAEE